MLVFSTGVDLQGFSEEQVYLGSRSHTVKRESDPIIAGSPGEG